MREFVRTTRMGIARRKINVDQGFSHVIFRTNSGEYFFKPREIKLSMIEAGIKYKDKYGIKIIDYCLMSTHAHFTMYYATVDGLSRFMHDMNLAIAKTVNGYFRRRGKAISDRFKSPVICDMSYCMNVTDYIWMNPVNAGMISIKKAQDYEFCSLFYRYRGIKDPLADSYQDLLDLTGFDMLGHTPSEQRFAHDRLNALKSKAIEQLAEHIINHIHTIGPPEIIRVRSESLKSKSPQNPDSS